MQEMSDFKKLVILLDEVLYKYNNLHIFTYTYFHCFFSFPVLTSLGLPKDISTSADDKGKFMLLNTYDCVLSVKKANVSS